MNCYRCGSKINHPDGFCQACGAQQTQQGQQPMHLDTWGKHNAPMPGQKRKTGGHMKSIALLAVILAASVVLVVVVIIVMNIGGQEPDSPQMGTPLMASKLLDLGEKYLLDLNYEQALVQFLGVIEIEPMNPRGYIGASDALVGLGDIDGAIEILERGAQMLPGNVEIQERLDEIQSEPELPPEPPEDTQDNERLLGALLAYYEVLAAAVDENGIGNVGVSYAELFDFDRDGIPEMIFTVGIEVDPMYGLDAEWGRIYIYGFADNAELYFDRTKGSMPGDLYLFNIVVGDDGVIYLWHRYYGNLDASQIYFSLRDGDWVTDLVLYSYMNEDWSDEIFELNDELVSEQVFNNAPQTELGITDDGRGIPRNPATVQSVLNELESTIAELQAN